MVCADDDDMTADQASPAPHIQGFVELIDEDAGVSGWVLDRRAPMTPLTVELRAGATPLATASTGGERPDVCGALRVEARPGFRFEAPVGALIRAAAAEGRAEDLVVHVVTDGAAMALPGAVRPLELVAFNGSRDAPVTADRLAALLAIHARTAARRLAGPLPPLPERQTGMLESLSLDEHGRIWVIGWMAQDRTPDRPMFILDEGRHAAGFAVAPVRRDDLPPGSTGFVGLLHTEWQPSATVAPYLQTADAGDRFLEPVRPTPVKPWATMAPLIAHSLAHAGGPYRELLRALFHVTPRWSLPDAPPPGERLQIDEVAILPGFGAFVTGWALSPVKQAVGFALKAGRHVATADDDSLSHHDRPDVASLYPDMTHALETAGFVATFRGAFDDAAGEGVILKVLWSDGSSTNDRARPGMIRILGRTAPLDAAQTFYPQIEHERFFADFARHAAADARQQARGIRPYEVQPAAAVLVLAAPAREADLFLLYDHVLRQAAALPVDWGVAIVAASDQLRTTLISLVADIRREIARPCSLFFTRAGRPTTDALGAVLDAVDARHFAYVDAGVTLTAAGWRAIAASDGITLLAIDDPADATARPRLGPDAFLADRATWQAVAARAAPRIGGSALPGTHRVIAAAAMSLGARVAPPLVARINEALGDA